MTVRVFGISKTGLTALALSVAALWTCLGIEAAERHLSDRNIATSLRTQAALRRLRRDRVMETPARTPLPALRPGRPYSS